MLVSKSMKRKVITIKPDESILKAQATMAENSIRHLPVVVDGDRLAGIVSDRDVRSAMPSSLLDGADLLKEKTLFAQFMVRDIMTIDPITVRPTDTIQDALLLIQKARVGAFPVVDDDGRLKGIVSVRDLLASFINVLGIGEPGTLLGIIVEEKVGQMKRIVDIITAQQISIGSILVARTWDKEKRAVFPYLLTLNISQVQRQLAEAGFELLDPLQWYMNQLPQS